MTRTFKVELRFNLSPTRFPSLVCSAMTTELNYLSAVAQRVSRHVHAFVALHIDDSIAAENIGYGLKTPELAWLRRASVLHNRSEVGG